MSWTKVSERLPEPYERVLFVIEQGFVTEGYFDEKDNFFNLQSYPANNPLQTVIAWMPMPEYKEDKE